LNAGPAGRGGVVLVLMDSGQPERHWTLHGLTAALRHLGIPFALCDLAAAPPSAEQLAEAAALVIGQEYLTARLGRQLLSDLLGAVHDGLGLVSVDGALGDAEGDYLAAIGLGSAPGRASSEAVHVAAGVGWITAARPVEERLALRRPVRLAAATPLRGQVLASDEAGRPALWATTLGAGRIVQWALSTTVWAPESLGFAAGLDDLLWRGIAWAARKPFVMKPMPPFSRLRLDDCRGLWREAEDFAFLDVLNRFGQVPTLCLCLRSITPGGASRLADLARRGKVQCAPHVLSPDQSIFLGTSGYRYSEEELRQNFATVDEHFERWGIPISSVLSDHNHEFARASVPLLRARGIVHRMNVTAPDERWEDEHVDWRPRPYGLMTYAFDEVPETGIFVVFNHFTDFASARTENGPGRFLFDRGGGFGGVHWDFLNGLATPAGVDVGAAAERLALHERRGLESRFFGGSISHTHHMRYLTLAHWEEILAEVARRNAGLEVEPLGYDDIACYAVAHARTVLESVRLDGSEARLRIRGRAALTPRIQVLTEPEPGRIEGRWLSLDASEVDGVLEARVHVG